MVPEDGPLGKIGVDITFIRLFLALNRSEERYLTWQARMIRIRKPTTMPGRLLPKRCPRTRRPLHPSPWQRELLIKTRMRL